MSKRPSVTGYVPCIERENAFPIPNGLQLTSIAGTSSAGFVGRMPTRTVLAHCSDISCQLELMSREGFERELKAHLLLLGPVEIPATQFLSHRFLFDLLHSPEDPHAARHLLAESDSGALLVPVSQLDSNIVKVAEAMRDNGTRHALDSYPQLLEHAHWLRDSGVHCDTLAKRGSHKIAGSFGDELRRQVDSALAAILASASGGPDEPFHSYIRSFQNWVRDTFGESGSFAITKAWDHIRATQPQPNFARRLVSVFDTAYQFLFAHLRDAKVSLSADYLTRTMPQQLALTQYPSERTSAVLVHEWTSSLHSVMSPLRLSDVAQLARKGLFPDLREKVAAYQTGPRTEESAGTIGLVLRDCVDHLASVVKSDKATRLAIAQKHLDNVQKVRWTLLKTRTGALLVIACLVSDPPSPLGEIALLCLPLLDVFPEQPSTAPLAKTINAYVRLINARESA